MRRPTAYWSCIAAFAAAIALATSTTAPAASSSTVVISAYVPSVTNLATTGCAAGSAGRTDFGTVLPGTTALTSLDCTIQFGSSNDTARLRVAQQDGRGLGMYQPSRGVLDSAFDTDGIVTTATAPGTNDDFAHAVATQVDGRLVTAGYCAMGGATGTDICLTRYTTTGALDPTFGVGGRVTTAVAPGAGVDAGRAIAVQADGRIVVVGDCAMGGATGVDACLVRYNPGGSLDTTFDSDGIVTTATAPGTGADNARAVAIQADGRIVTAGYCAMGGATGIDACLTRYNSDGSLDTTFDADGRVTTATAAGAGDDYIRSIALHADGRIVTAGRCDMAGASGFDACVARYSSDGSLDTTFDADGRATTAIAPGTGDDAARAITVQVDGRIVIAGDCAMGGATGRDACLARYNMDGSLDTGFDTDGRVTTAIAPGTGADFNNAVVVQPDGRILAIGDCAMGGTTGNDACLARYNTDGSLDTTFDADGIVTTATAPGTGGDDAYAVALLADGRIAIAGACVLGGATGIDMCLAQYDNAGSMSQYADTVTDWDTPGTSMFAMCLRAVASGSASWATSATCPMTDGAYWNAAPAAATQIATATANTTTATAQLRFGMRAAPAQPPGSYIAPITFDVLAP